jgi:hypothetical protein
MDRSRAWGWWLDESGGGRRKVLAGGHIFPLGWLSARCPRYHKPGSNLDQVCFETDQSAAQSPFLYCVGPRFRPSRTPTDTIHTDADSRWRWPKNISSHPPEEAPGSPFLHPDGVIRSIRAPASRFLPDLVFNPSGELRPSPVPPGSPGDSRREKSGDRPALSAREYTNHTTLSTQIPPPLSLLCRRRHHPSPIRRPVA